MRNQYMSIIEKFVRKLPKKEVTPEELEQKGKKRLERQIPQPISVAKEEAPEEEEDELDENGEYKVYEREILPEKIVCPDCGGITLEGLDFCSKCGSPLN